MIKKHKALCSRSDRSRYRFDRKWCSSIHSFICLLILFVLWASREMIPSSITYASLKVFELEKLADVKHVTPKLKGGKVFKLPAAWDRYQTPWFYRPDIRSKTPEQSNQRYLYSPTRQMTSDGIGHSMGAVNFEYNMALRLNLTYTHRVGFYSSLSMKDRYAVENFFGWGDNEVHRKDLQSRGCDPRNMSWPDDDDLYQCFFCEHPRKGGGMNIKQIINLPSKFGLSSCHSPSCKYNQQLFVRKHHQSNTIFQLNSDSCEAPVTDSNMLGTKNMFYNKYWNKHGRLLWSHSHRSTTSKRHISFNPGRLNIAMHVRRGDFLKRETQKKRTLTSDQVFANVFVSAMSIVHRTKGPFASMPIALHIYSEGKLVKDKVLSTHDVGMQDKAYYDSTGVERDHIWWKKLIMQRIPNEKEKSFETALRRMNIHLHISEDTIDSLHDMIAADVFIGSASGLSVSLVWSISRGVVLIPHHSSIDNERGKKGGICCSVPFENDNGQFPAQLFKAYWRAYIAANGESAARSCLLVKSEKTSQKV